ncbi:aldehyde dehydrogenase [Cordyceps javanica]|uniref:Aldehyde dehydrogenase n=1 Tax=Cordyceps javanica TaxID=43265 RepID=A0A545W999_9HYPO|nr:aldehyde dehydrogenase [Cordyceps javanica]TQW10508.1 aldehyde dehydrogenase [Cordyceps javanica]
MDATNMLDARYIGSRCPSGWYFRNGYCYRSGWYSWGRWVLVGVLIFFALVFLFLCSCCARRRARKGAKPFMGTGWMAGNKWGGNNNQNNQNTYNQGYAQQSYPQQGYPQQGYDYNQQQQGYQAPPNYGNAQQPQNTGTTFNPNDGYYGNQQYGGPQHPPNTYQPEGGYAPPPGPPPTK